MWAAARQNQQYGRCAHRRLRSARASTQSDQSSLCAQWEARDLMILHADSEVSDRTGRIPRLIHVFAGRTCHFVGFVMLPRSWLANSAKNQTEKVIAYGYHVALNNILLLSCHRLLFCTGLNIMELFRFAAGCFASGCINDRVYIVCRGSFS